jgi:hypothetical protein
METEHRLAGDRHIEERQPIEDLRVQITTTIAQSHTGKSLERSDQGKKLQSRPDSNRRFRLERPAS